MSDWVETDPEGSRVTAWLHVPTGVELFVQTADEEYGVHIGATDGGPVDRVSIGDPETGLFRTFEERERAVEWADEWKDSEAVRRALETAAES